MSTKFPSNPTQGRFENAHSTYISKSGVTVNGVENMSRSLRRSVAHSFEASKSHENARDADLMASYAGGKKHFKASS